MPVKGSSFILTVFSTLDIDNKIILPLMDADIKVKNLVLYINICFKNLTELLSHVTLYLLQHVESILYKILKKEKNICKRQHVNICCL